MHFISSAMASFCLETTVEDAMQTVRDAGFDSLDFPLSVYSRPQDAPLRGDDWRQWARGVRRTADRIGLPITQAHASWEQAIPDDLHYDHLMKSMSGRWRPRHPRLPPADLPSGAVSAPHAGPQPLAAHPRLERPLVPRASAAGGEVRHCDQSGKHVRLSPSAAAGRRARALHNGAGHAGARLRHRLEPCAALPRHRPCPHQRAGRARR